MNGNGTFREDELVVRRQKINGEWVEIPYPKLGGRLRVLHEQQGNVSITTEIHQLQPEFVVVRATVTTDKGTYTGTGTASAQRDSRLADSLVELAESRAIARAARFAGVGVEYCSAEEVSHVEAGESFGPAPQPKSRERVFSAGNGKGKRQAGRPNGGAAVATQAQCRALYALTKKAQYSKEDIENLLSPLNASTFQELPREEASRLISYLQTEVAA
jgi:hypothetical protein